MNRADILETLCRHKPEMQRCFGVRSFALFGSHAREAARANSDIDMLVEFDSAATSERHFGLQFFLEDLLGAPSIWSPDRSCDPSCAPTSSATRSMSDAAAPREWRFYVEDMVAFCDTVLGPDHDRALQHWLAGAISHYQTKRLGKYFVLRAV
jgi:predicted nucleotidyltransferase